MKKIGADECYFFSKSRARLSCSTFTRSGLDPHLSPQGALVQVPRVALARRLDATRVRELVSQHTETNPIGPDRVNVLQLNLALDLLKK